MGSHNYTQTQSPDKLFDFLNLVSTAFDQLMSQVSQDPDVQINVIKRVSNFTESLFNLRKTLGMQKKDQRFKIDILPKIDSSQVIFVLF